MHYKIEKLTDSIVNLLSQKEKGHCLRIHDLNLDDSLMLCTLLNSKSNGFVSYVICNDKNAFNERNAYQITLDAAIELRNRKDTSLCLIFSPGIDVPASLINTFETFNTIKFLADLEKEILNRLPEEILDITKSTLKHARYGVLGRDIRNEEVIEFLETILATPTVETVGNSLWMIGLIPDKDQDFYNRITLNYNSVREIAKPTKPHLTIRQRLENTALRKGDFLDRLEKYLGQYNLYPAKRWLKALGQSEEFTFDNWEFPKIEESDLEEIILKKPKRTAAGKLVLSCGDLKCESAESSIIAQCGPNKKINISWETIPKNPLNVGGWLVELIPSREDYDQEDYQNDLPQVITKASTKKAKLDLDFDLEDITTRWVQVRITPLDENENQICIGDNKLEALSERILLEKQSYDEEKKPKQLTYSNFPFAFLQLAKNFKGDKHEWNTISQGWTEDESLSYFKAQVNETLVCRISISNILKYAETELLNNPDSAGRFYYDVLDVENSSIDELNVRPLFSKEFLSLNYLQIFLNKRKDIFNKIRTSYGESGIVEIISDWTSILTKVKNYAESYNSFLESISSDSSLDTNSRSTLLGEALSIDSIELNIRYNTGNQKALVLLPTHPFRLIWFASYSVLLDEWRDQLLEISFSGRKTAINFDYLEQIQSTNLPYLIPNEGSKGREEWYLFIKNINFFVALYLPVYCEDWARVSADVVKFLGYDEEYALSEIKPGQISQIISDYLKHNTLVKTRGINIGVVNPGNGELISSALSKVIFPDESLSNIAQIKRINISAVANSPLPLEIISFEKLRQQFYYSEEIAENCSALTPALSYYLTERSVKPEFPNGNQNLIFYINALKPNIDIIDSNKWEEIENISFYGLVNRWVTMSASDRGQFQTLYWIPSVKAARFERHPVDGVLTDILLNCSKSLSSSLSFLITKRTDQNNSCCLKSSIGPDERGFIEYLHQQSDWVITVDRFLGPEFFDSPTDVNLSNLSEKYLIDYTPSFSEGIGERLLLSTCWTDNAKISLKTYLNNELGHIQEFDNDFSCDKILKSLKLFSGNLFFKLLENDEGVISKVTRVGLMINNLIETNQLDNSVLIPCLYDNSYQDKIVDFMLVSCTSDKLIFECLVIEGKENSEMAIEKLENTETYLNTLSDTEENHIGIVLDRSNIVTQLRYYLQKARRYGLIKDTNKTAKFNELFSKYENGKAVTLIKLKLFLIDFKSIIEKEILEENNSIQIITHSARSLNIDCSINEKETIKSSFETKTEVGKNEIANDEGISKDELASVQTDYVMHEGSIQTKEYPSIAKLELGITNSTQQVFYEPSTKGSPHAIILGIPGQGKSVTLNSLLVQLSNQGVGSLVFDFHGQFSSSDNPFVKYCSPLIWDALVDKLPFSPFEYERPEDLYNKDFYLKMLSAEIADIFEYVCELGTIQRYSLYETLVSLFKSKSVVKSNSFITIEELKKKLKQAEKDNNVRNVLARTSKLLEMNLFADQGEWDILNTTKKGLVINLKSIGEGTVQNAVGAFILRKLYKEILKWEETDKIKLAIVLDEAHRLSKDITLPLIMQEARKFGVMIVIASQNLNHFHPNIIQNVGTKILFRTNSPASNNVGQLVNMRQGKDPRRVVEGLRVGQALVQTPLMKLGEIVQMNMIT